MKKNVLVVGCGGIGCELIKLLIQGEVIQLTLIDFDKIELSNLNRQFLFLDEDIGRYKSQVISEKIINLRPNWSIRYLVDNIRNYDITFFEQFDIVYNCLDNNESREYVNLRCYLTNTKLVDGGSSGYKGQSCYFDYKNECFDCLPKPVSKKYHVCTVRGIPTRFEHCIEFVKTIIFEELGDPFSQRRVEYYKRDIKDRLEVNNLEETNNQKREIRRIVKLIKKVLKKSKARKDKNGYKIKYDKDDYDINQLMYKLSCIRAKSANIEVMSFFEAQTVANNIISSICSTNSMVASLMLLSEKNNMNYFMGISRRCILKVHPNSKKEDCSVCSCPWLILKYKKDSTVEDLFDFMKPQFTCKYLLDSEMNYFSFLPNNLNEALKAERNTTATVGYLDLNEIKIIKIYFIDESNEFEIIKMIDTNRL